MSWIKKTVGFFLTGPSFRQLLWPLLALLVLFFAFRGTIFDPQRVYLYRDFWMGLLPQKYLWSRTILEEGMLPLWNRFIFGGNVFLADLKSAVYYPLNLILLLFPLKQFALAFSWYVFLHHIFMFCGSYLVLRQLKLKTEGAALFSLVYALSGVAVSGSNLSNVHAVLWQLPFFHLFLMRHLERPNKFNGNIFGLAVFIALPVYSAAAEYSFILGLTYFLFALKTYHGRQKLRIFVVPVFGLALAMAHLLPGLVHLQKTKQQPIARFAHYAPANQASFHPIRLADFAFSLPFGNINQKAEYRARNYLNTPNRMPMIASFYLGGASVSLLILALFVSLPAFGLATGCAVFFWLAIGQYAYFDLYSFLNESIPLLSLFRYPEKLMVFVFYLIFVRLSISAPMILRQPVHFFARFTPAFLFILLGLLTASLVLYLSGIGTVGDVFGSAAVLRFLLFNALFMLWCLCSRFAAFQKWQMPLLALMLLPDVYGNAMQLHWDQPVSLLNQTLPGYIKKDLRARKDAVGKGAAFRYSFLPLRDNEIVLPEEVDRSMTPVANASLMHLNKMMPSTGVLYGISHVSGSGVIFEKSRLAFVQRLLAGDRQRYHNIFGAYYLAAPPDSEMPIFHAKRNEDALPFVFLPKTVQFIPNREAVWSILLGPGFNEKLQAIAMSVPAERVFRQNGAVTKVWRPNNGRIEVEFKSETGQEEHLLLVNETFDMHWRAYRNTDGKRLETFPGNYWATMIRFTGSCHKGCHVVLRYENPYIWLGQITTLTAILFFLSVLFTPYLRKAILSSCTQLSFLKCS